MALNPKDSENMLFGFIEFVKSKEFLHPSGMQKIIEIL